MSKLTPNKDAYEKLRTTGQWAKATLLLRGDATWHIVKHMSNEEFIAEGYNVTQIWRGWEDMLRSTTHDSLKTIHNKVWPDVKIGKALATKEALCLLIWNYRCSQAIDHTVEVQTTTGVAKNPLQRASSIAGRVYKVITPSADAKPYTSPAAMACLKIIKDVCEANGGSCTEGQLKPVIMARASEITPKTNSAWRFLQFYRPLLVNAEMITYTK